MLLDSGLRVLVANAAFYRTFDVTPAVVRRRSLFDLAHGRWDSPELHAVLQELQEQDIAFENHEVRVTIDGQPRMYRLNARKLDSSESGRARPSCSRSRTSPSSCAWTSGCAIWPGWRRSGSWPGAWRTRSTIR